MRQAAQSLDREAGNQIDKCTHHEAKRCLDYVIHGEHPSHEPDGSDEQQGREQCPEPHR